LSDDTQGDAASAASPCGAGRSGALPEPTAHCPRHEHYEPPCLTCRSYAREQQDMLREQITAGRDQDESAEDIPLPSEPEPEYGAGDDHDLDVPGTHTGEDDSGSGDEFPPPDAPMAVARQIFEAYQRPEGRTLVSWRGGWLHWEGPRWQEFDIPALRSAVYHRLENARYEHPKTGPTQWNPNRYHVANVMEAMAAIGHLGAGIDPPSWLDGAPVTSSIIACRNGLLHVADRSLTAHTPKYFNLVDVPFDYDAHAPEPTVWLKFLASVWPDDRASIALLQEYTGYLLSGRTDMQKLLLLIGPTRSGKGTYARLLSKLLGRDNLCGPTLASMGTNFGLMPLLGKPLAIVADARLGSGDTRVVVERLLSITGEDMLTVDRKFKAPWSGKLPTRFIILSNELPRFGDASGAIANRFLILQMTKSFLGNEDRTLDDRLELELPGILRWALEGLDRLVRQGHFTVPASSNDAATLMMDLSSPISAFVRDRCVRVRGAYVESTALFQAWKTWCDDQGHQAGSNATFGQHLRAAVPGLLVSQQRLNGKRVRRYERIGLNADGDDEDDSDSAAPSRALNADLPVPPVPPKITTGQNGFSVDDMPVPPELLPVPHARAGTGRSPGDTGRVSGKQQVDQGGTSGTGKSAFKALRENAHEQASKASTNSLLSRPGEPLCRVCQGRLGPVAAADGVHADCAGKLGLNGSGSAA